MTNYCIQLACSTTKGTAAEFYQPGFFFNESVHLQQQHARPFYELTALNQRTGKVEARCALFLTDNEAVSPIAAPFGSIEFAADLPDAVLDAFVEKLTETAQSAGPIRRIRLTNYPCCYAPSQAERLLTKLPEHGFQLIDANPTFYLTVDNSTFRQNIVSAEHRRLRKCHETGFVFQKWPDPNVDKVVNFVQETRRQQGYPLTISPDNLARLLRTFPERFLVFTVMDGPQLTALTVAVRVREDILYSFLPASDPAYRTFSPMVMLTEGLFSYCQQQSIGLLDLGTSLDGNSQPKPSLMRFKRNLGALESPKFVFECSLAWLAHQRPRPGV